MKAAAFEYHRASSVGQALDLFNSQSTSYSKFIGGGQSLGAMMNLRLVQPDRLIDISSISELALARQDGDTLHLGGGVRHAQIEDGQVPDVTNGLLAFVAHGIAHRAVRNRGTIGGSLVHADPCADWVATMRLLDPELTLRSGEASRTLAARDFFLGAFTTAIEEDEILVGLELPCFSTDARWAYHKTCRKPGEFAEALAAIWIDPDRNIHRAVIGALSTTPHLIEGQDALQALQRESGRKQALETIGVTDPVEQQMQSALIERALVTVGLKAGHSR